MPVTADDLLEAVAVQSNALLPAADHDWSAPAGDLDASCRDTLDHVISALTFYSAQLASRAASRLPRLRHHDLDASLEDAFELVDTAAAILTTVSRGSEPGARAFHPAGIADAEGFLAMGCDEVLVHTGDIAAGLGIAFTPPAELCARVLARLFPWAPIDSEPWMTLLWANGRAPLSSRPRLDSDWYWHAAPLVEWDGTVARRTHPPSWQP